jgi:hypothetical protein
VTDAWRARNSTNAYFGLVALSSRRARCDRLSVYDLPLEKMFARPEIGVAPSWVNHHTVPLYLLPPTIFTLFKPPERAEL